MRALTFQAGGERIGLRLDYVHEVVRVDTKIRELGGAPPAIRGLLDVRGRVVTLLDTCVLLGSKAGLAEGEEFAAVLHEPGRGVGFLLPAEMEIQDMTGEILDDERGMDPFVEGVVECVLPESEETQRIVLLNPSVILETCRDEVRSRFLTRAAM